MNSRNLTFGLLDHWINCIPESVDTFLKCTTSPNKVDAYALQAVSLGRPVKYIVLDQFSSPANFNRSSVDTSSLLGQLSVVMIDWVADPVIVTEKRSNYIDYGFVTVEDNICIFESGCQSVHQSNSTYFLTVFDKLVTLFFCTIFLFYTVINLAVANMVKKQVSFSWLRKSSFGLASFCFVPILQQQFKN